VCLRPKENAHGSNRKGDCLVSKADLVMKKKKILSSSENGISLVEPATTLFFFVLNVIK
jgi:hypothetical protein